MTLVRHIPAAAVLAVLVAGCASAPPSATVPPSPASSVVASPAVGPTTRAASPSVVPSSSMLPEPVDIEAAGATAIEASTAIDWAVVLDGQAWIAGLGDGIGALDASGGLLRSAAVSGWCEAMDTGFGAVWSASCDPGGIIRIDPRRATVRRGALDLPIAESEASIGAGEGAVWVVAGSTSDTTLFRVDPRTLQVEGRNPMPAGSAAVRAGFGGAWVTRPGADELLHVDPSSGEIVATIAVGPTPRFLALGEGSVWVMNQEDGTVSRVDPATDTVTATIDSGDRIHGGDIAVGGGSVWVRGGPELLARIDPARNLVTERYGPDAGSGSVAADEDAVWVTAHDVATIWRLPLR